MATRLCRMCGQFGCSQGKRIKIFPFDLFGTLTGAYALSRRCLRFKERHAGGLAFG
jgi:hypothetical protein